MGASGMGGGGKSANVELNLVPFIDLLSVLITFLLTTAVWQQYSVVSSNAPPKSTAEIPPDQPITPPPDDKKKVMLVISLGTDKIEVAEDETIQPIPHLGTEPNFQAVAAVLKEWKRKYPDRKDLVLATDNKAKYKHLITMMDTLKIEEFPDIGINLN